MIKIPKTIIIGLFDTKIRILREILFRTALGDGILSESEIKILSSIDLNLDLLYCTVVSAYEDNVIDHSERDEFERLIEKIEDEAVSTAKFDDCVTSDDMRLIKILGILLIDFQKLLLKNF